MYRSVNEILCGLEGVDWVPDPGDPNGDPTNPAPGEEGEPWCPNGIYDPAGDVGQAVVVQTFDNEPGSPGANLYQARTAVSLGPAGVSFFGGNYNLKPGEAYLVTLGDTVADRVFQSPHF
jgi:hypothetical protein